MCRHLAYLGPERTVHDLVYAAPHSLEVQAYAPRMSASCLLNADGFGVGWYAQEPGSGPAGSGDAGTDTEPPAAVRYRRTGPIWNDVSFAEVARVVRARCLVAAVRSATPGFPADESCAQPFRAGRWLFSHNGRVDGFPALEERLRERAHAALTGGDGHVSAARGHARVSTVASTALADLASTDGGPDTTTAARLPGVSSGSGAVDTTDTRAPIDTMDDDPAPHVRLRARTNPEAHAHPHTGTAAADDRDVPATGWAEVPDARAPVDSALLFAIAVGHWRRGAPLADGLAEVVDSVPGLASSRLNLLATDGARLAATAWGDTLFTRGEGTESGVVIASEPFDDDPDWKPVPDRSLVIADATGLRVRPLA